MNVTRLKYFVCFKIHDLNLKTEAVLESNNRKELILCMSAFPSINNSIQIN